MNKLIIGLLIVAAAGAGIFFYLRKEKNDTPATLTNKELIVGKWKTNSFEPVFDSVQHKYTYTVAADGSLLRSLSDSTKTDSLRYEWKSTNELSIKENDSTSVSYIILQLTSDSLQWQTKDSVKTLLLKVK